MLLEERVELSIVEFSSVVVSVAALVVEPVIMSEKSTPLLCGAISLDAFEG